jgi:hypothetical protein
VVRPDGALQRVGAFSEAGWSPHGLHVIGVRGRRLTAVTPTGTVKWTLWRRRPVHRPAWSLGAGFRVAYLEREALRVVAGDGTGDRLVRRRATPVTPAWRPGRRQLLTDAGPAGSIETVDVDARRRVWARRAADPVTALAWSRGGKRLVALTVRGLTVYGRGGRRLFAVRLSEPRALALDPSGRRAAVTVERRGGTQLLAVRLAPAGGSRLIDGGPGRAGHGLVA